ncbi:MAG: 6-bladed beta-propeller [Bacteroidia bacterium]|nr:6-bladed beta-propeller [Bacteroidia bacterium]
MPEKIVQDEIVDIGYDKSPIMNLISRVWIVLILGLCVSSNALDLFGQVAEYNVRVDKALIKNAPALDLTRMAKEIRLIPLETSEDCLIGTIDKVTVIEDKIFILSKGSGDNKESWLLIFKSNGEFISRVGTKGKGPGEYTQLMDFAVNRQNGDILLLSYNQILCFSASNSYKHTINLNFGDRGLVANIEIQDDGNIVCEGDGKFRLIVIDSKGNPISRYSLYETGNIHWPTPLTCFKDRILVHLFFNDTIYSLRKGSLKPYVYVDFGKNAITYKSYLEMMKTDPRQPFAQGSATMNFVCENQKTIIATFTQSDEKFQLWIDKDTRKYRLFRMGNGNLFEENLPRELSCSDKGEWVVWLDAYQVAGKLKELLTSNPAKVRFDAQKISRVTEDSNPILMIFTTN